MSFLVTSQHFYFHEQRFYWVTYFFTNVSLVYAGYLSATDLALFTVLMLSGETVNYGAAAFFHKTSRGFSTEKTQELLLVTQLEASNPVCLVLLLCGINTTVDTETGLSLFDELALSNVEHRIDVHTLLAAKLFLMPAYTSSMFFGERDVVTKAVWPMYNNTLYVFYSFLTQLGGLHKKVISVRQEVALRNPNTFSWVNGAEVTLLHKVAFLEYTIHFQFVFSELLQDLFFAAPHILTNPTWYCNTSLRYMYLFFAKYKNNTIDCYNHSLLAARTICVC